MQLSAAVLFERLRVKRLPNPVQPAGPPLPGAPMNAPLVARPLLGHPLPDHPLPELTDQDRDQVTLAERILGYTFANPALCRQALTSPGWCNEHRASGWQSRKLLEWLGDAALYLVLTERSIEGADESALGELAPQRDTAQSNRGLAEGARQRGLQDALFLGVGERHTNLPNSTRLLADPVEALLGAVWIDQRRQDRDPFAAARGVIERWTPAP